ncbi:hypothetical protein ACFOW6_16385 [Fodinicurvata halophila]|uniref:Uncharacterized protein n=1 Tax=Fodinicurvata halophila TaxID=1419723 RepID=A0ABV8UPU3_9PROT
MQVFGNTGALLIENQDRGVGLAVRENDGFRFVALDPRYDRFDGQYFSSPEEIERTVKRGHADASRRNGQQPPAHAA